MKKNDMLLYLTLHEILIPWESAILRLQRLIAWQQPLHSLVFTIFIHGAFWYIALCDHNLLLILAVALFTANLFDFWKMKIWPWLSIPFRFLFRRKTANQHGWESVDKRFFTVHEICSNIGSGITRFNNTFESVFDFRRRRRFLFFLGSLAAWSCIAYIGLFVNGQTLVYAAIIIGMLVPMARYHHFSQHVRRALAPVMRRVDAELSRVQLETPEEAEKQEAAFIPHVEGWKQMIEHEIDRDDSDTEESLQEFIPTSSLSTSFMAPSLPIAQSDVEGFRTPLEFSTVRSSEPIHDEFRMEDVFLDDPFTDSDLNYSEDIRPSSLNVQQQNYSSDEDDFEIVN